EKTQAMRKPGCCFERSLKATPHGFVLLKSLLVTAPGFHKRLSKRG
ncbi:MAG: hypothetical protein ACI9NC_005553, partial [Verrucomicrobiales bacterium]